jgi:single-strand DNA-binding protein
MALPRVHGVFRAAADPELRFTPSGMALCKVRAVASSRKEVNGEWVDDKTCWVNLTTFKTTAENVAESIQKGMLIVVEGRLQTDDWEDKDGNKRTSIEIVCDSLAPDLSWATARVTKTERSGGGGSQSSNRGAPAEDPWATPVGQDDEPPF